VNVGRCVINHHGHTSDTTREGVASSSPSPSPPLPAPRLINCCAKLVNDAAISARLAGVPAAAPGRPAICYTHHHYRH
jgi:hypothetical protein